MTHVYNPNFLETEIGQIKVHDSPSKNVSDTHLNKQPGILACACAASYMGGIGRRILIGDQLEAKTKILSEKIIEAKRAGVWLKW
jgi:hypothetical protein